MKRKTREIAPRVRDAKGGFQRREAVYLNLPPDIEAGLDAIARGEGRSRSWVIEEVVISWFGFKTPNYVRPVAFRKRYGRAA